MSDVKTLTAALRDCVASLEGYRNNCQCEGGGQMCDAEASARALLASSTLLQKRSQKAITATPTPTSASVVSQALGRFGHHPDPAIDFCVEVEELEAKRINRHVGFDPEADLERRIEGAMTFMVGGDPIAVVAKRMLRNIEVALLKSVNEKLNA